jgi:phosphatidate cytidylyltransferase
MLYKPKPMSSLLSTMKTRALTGFIFAVIMLAGVLYSAWTYALLWTVVAFGAAGELFNLMAAPEKEKVESDKMFRFFARFAAILPVLLAIAMSMSVSIDPLFASILSACFIGIMLIVSLFYITASPIRQLGSVALAFGYIGLPLGLITYIGVLHGFRWEYALSIVLLTWANDTMAYGGGSVLGRTPFWPRHSPKKTWEGTGVGLISAAILGYFLPKLFLSDFTAMQGLVLGLIVAITGSLGDLAESMLKRRAGIKDSGTLLPGHGGLLDRFDAFFVSVPFVALFLYLIGKI